VALTVAFVRHRERRDRVYVTRDDGTSTFWDFPSYGDRLPHDLCHLVVEEGLGIVNGFWGMVDQGVAVKLVDNQATLVRDGTPLCDQPGFDFSDLTKAEDAVAVLGSTGLGTEHVGALAVARLDGTSGGPPDAHRLAAALGVDLPPGATEATVTAIGRRLAELDRRWRDLDDGDAITMTFAIADGGV